MIVMRAMYLMLVLLIVSSLVVELIPGKRPIVMGPETYYRRHRAGFEVPTHKLVEKRMNHGFVRRKKF